MVRLCFKPFFHWRRRLPGLRDYFALSVLFCNIVWFSLRIYGYGVTLGFKWIDPWSKKKGE